MRMECRCRCTHSRVGDFHLIECNHYLRLAKLHVGLLVNFNVPILQDGVKRVVL
ncbi:MAG: hypothetical protein DMG00_13135 [Acidobacteria bacterium]|nr:MAG: hypothetical protein DMG00_13135 [Acidobacteriota bacterium]